MTKQRYLLISTYTEKTPLLLRHMTKREKYTDKTKNPGGAPTTGTGPDGGRQTASGAHTGTLPLKNAI